MSKEKRLYFNTLVSTFKKSDASAKSIEAIFDFVYLLEKEKQDYKETLLLTEAYSLLHLHQKAYNLFSLVNTESFSSKEIKKHQQTLQELKKNTRLQNHFYYRDLREARTTKEITQLAPTDFSAFQEEKKYRVAVKEHVGSIVIFNKYISVADIFITSDQPNLECIASYILWLGDCKEELINYYKQHDFPYKIDNIDETWFHGLNVSDVEIEIKEGVIYSYITIIDYCNGNLGFHLETRDRTISSIEYDPIL
ncbi:hypothetical protein [Kordia sp.]|uniref:hypothetical protein n=1 Tax=Kordia sp. TaxID=1965332 RepID=UPI003B5AB516